MVQDFQSVGRDFFGGVGRRPITTVLLSQALVGALGLGLLMPNAGDDLTGFATDVLRPSLAGTSAARRRDAYLNVWTRSDLSPRIVPKVDLPKALEVSAPFAPEETWQAYEQRTSSRDLPEEVPGAGAPANDSSDDDAVVQGETSFQDFMRFSVHLLYRVGASQNLLETRYLMAIRRFEERLRQLPGWSRLCAPSNGAADGGCDPGESLTSMAWPERRSDADTGPAKEGFCFNGLGFERLPAEVLLKALLFGDGGAIAADRARRLLPLARLPASVDEEFATDVLQSHFLFSIPVPSGEPSPSARSLSQGARARAAAAARFRSFVAEVLWPTLAAGDDGLRAEGIELHFRGAGLDDEEIVGTMGQDCYWAAVPAAALLLVVLAAAMSLPVALFAVFLVTEATVLGYGFFVCFTGYKDTTVFSAVVLFVLAPAAADVVVAGGRGMWHMKVGDIASPQPRSPASAASVTGGGYSPARSSPALSSAPTSGGGCLPAVVGMLCATGGYLANLAGAPPLAREIGLHFGLSVACVLILLSSVYLPVVHMLPPLHPGHRCFLPCPCFPAGGAGLGVSRSGGGSGGSGAWSPGPGAGAGDGGRGVASMPAGLWLSFLRVRWGSVMVVSAALTALSVVGIEVGLCISAQPQPLLPAGHRHLVGRELLGRFAPVAALPTASGALLQRGWACGVGTDDRLDADGEEACQDKDLGCGAWAGTGECQRHRDVMSRTCPRSCGFCDFCLFERCVVDSSLSLDETPGRGRCDCFDAMSPEVDSGVAGDSGAVAEPRRWRVGVDVVGLPTSFWPVLSENLTRLVLRMVPGLLGAELVELVDEVPVGAEAATSLPPLVQEHWRSGEVAMWQGFKAPAVTISAVAPARLAPRFRCFCGGAAPCGSLGPTVGSFDFDADATARQAAFSANESVEAESIALTTSSPPVPMSDIKPPVHISVVWGLSVREAELFSRPPDFRTWDFDRRFLPRDPWAQRSVLLMADLPAHLAARPEEPDQETWLLTFERWLREQGDAFPVREGFAARLAAFFLDRPELAKNAIFEADEVVALRIGFVSEELALSSSLRAVSLVQAEWNDYVLRRNLNASENANSAWHTSELWLPAEAKHALSDGLVVSLLVTLGVGAALSLCLLRDFVLASAVVWCVSSSAIVGGAFVTWLIAYDVGPLEAVALVASFGQAFTFSLHVAYAYRCAPPCELAAPGASPSSVGGRHAQELAENERFDRVTIAFQVSAAQLVLTLAAFICSTLIMFLPTLTFFRRFGMIVLAMTVIAVAHACALMPALLLAIGPVKNRTFRQTVAAIARQLPGDCLRAVRCGRRSVRSRLCPADAQADSPAAGDSHRAPVGFADERAPKAAQQPRVPPVANPWVPEPAPVVEVVVRSQEADSAPPAVAAGGKSAAPCAAAPALGPAALAPIGGSAPNEAALADRGVLLIPSDEGHSSSRWPSHGSSRKSPCPETAEANSGGWKTPLTLGAMITAMGSSQATLPESRIDGPPIALKLKFLASAGNEELFDDSPEDRGEGWTMDFQVAPHGSEASQAHGAGVGAHSSGHSFAGTPDLQGFPPPQGPEAEGEAAAKPGPPGCEEWTQARAARPEAREDPNLQPEAEPTSRVPSDEGVGDSRDPEAGAAPPCSGGGDGHTTPSPPPGSPGVA